MIFLSVVSLTFDFNVQVCFFGWLAIGNRFLVHRICCAQKTLKIVMMIYLVDYIVVVIVVAIYFMLRTKLQPMFDQPKIPKRKL